MADELKSTMLKLAVPAAPKLEKCNIHNHFHRVPGIVQLYESMEPPTTDIGPELGLYGRIGM